VKQFPGGIAHPEKRFAIRGFEVAVVGADFELGGGRTPGKGEEEKEEGFVIHIERVEFEVEVEGLKG